MVMQDIFSHTPRKDILNLVKSTIIFTITSEIAGAALLYIHWGQLLPFTEAIYTSVFHSVSAFCNAGFCLFPDSMIRYSDSLLINVVICALIILGGVGFPVLYDLQSWVNRPKKQHFKLSVQTKTVLVTTFFLIVAGTLLFIFLEESSFKKTDSVLHRILISLFQSITCRTAGFNTVDIGSLRDATLAMMLFLMFIGASPGSCGGGVKTTTLALISAFTLSKMRGKKRVNMFKKSIPAGEVNRSISLLLMSIGVIGFILFMLLVGEPLPPKEIYLHGRPFLAYLFETISAFGTVGLSMGITPELTTWCKSWLIIMMMIGRVGILTFSYIIVRIESTGGIEYSEESIMIG
jgi:trk system potassium uptake protein TrkH